MIKSICSILAAFVFSTSAFGWSLHDVSILLPLPTIDDNPFTLSIQTQGAAGELLPASILNTLPSLGRQMSVNQLRVVSLRFDPCFPATVSVPHDCHSQIRMVWQPLAQVHGETIALDAAVHSFYELSPEEFKDFLVKIASASDALSGVPAELPLAVHPLLLKQGYAGPYWQHMRKIILSYTGEKRLSRVTFMDQVIQNKMWDLGGLDILQGRIQKIVIPRVNTRLQSFVNNAGATYGFEGGAKPAVEGADTFNSVLVRSSDLKRSDETLLRQNAQAIHRIENPNVHNPQTIDCVSCHTAQIARLWEVNHFQDLDLNNSFFKFKSNLNLTNVSPHSNLTVSLRAFGYFGRNVAISQRTINETAHIVELLNQRFTNKNVSRQKP